MDAVGLAASIGGLLGIASKVSLLCYSYFSEVMNAQEDIQQLVSEISSLAELLEPLSTPAQAGKISRTLDSDSILQLVQQCKDMLEKLQGELEIQCHPNKLSGRIAQRLRMTSLKWPFKKVDTQKGIQQIERLKSTVALKLQM